MRGESRQRNVNSAADLEFLEKFSVVICTNLSFRVAAEVESFLKVRNIPFICCTSLGLLGHLSLSAGEHEIHDNHLENAPFDFRLSCPFPKLKTVVDALDLDSLSHEQHCHVPFLLLYFKALPAWRRQQKDPNCLPTSGALKRSFVSFLNEMRKPNEKGVLDEANFQEAVDNLFRAFAGEKVGFLSSACMFRCRRTWRGCSRTRAPTPST